MPIVVPPSSPSASVTTSGTIGSTVIDTMLVIESAVRRCGKSPSTLSPEDLDTAKQNLFFILTALTNRGVNLWCVEQEIIPLAIGQKDYTLSAGTVDILNAVYRTSTRLETTSLTLTGSSSCTGVFSSALNVKTVGMKFPVAANVELVIEHSDDGISWSSAISIGAISVSAGWVWHDLDPGPTSTYIRVRETTGASLTLDDLYLTTLNSDVPIEQMSRDTYVGLSNKNSPGRPNQYLFDKQVAPIITLWPSPEDDTSQIVVWRQREIQDVGELSQKLEIPNRWLESTTWSLSKNLAFELKDVALERINLCIQQAAIALDDAEEGETDGAPIFMQPNIAGYSR